MLSKKKKNKQTNKREKKLIIYKICLAKYPREKSSPEKRPRENCPPLKITPRKYASRKATCFRGVSRIRATSAKDLFVTVISL